MLFYFRFIQTNKYRLIILINLWTVNERNNISWQKKKKKKNQAPFKHLIAENVNEINN